MAKFNAIANGDTVTEFPDEWLSANVKMSGSAVKCNSVTENNGVINLNGCKVGNSNTEYCYHGEEVIECSGKIASILGESYQNGTPSPNSPIEVQSVGDKTKNLLDQNTLFTGDSITTQGITYQKTADGILVNGATSTNWAPTTPISLLGILEVGKTYTMTANNGNVSIIFVSITDGSYNYSKTKTITGNESAINLYLQVAPNLTVDNVLL